MTKYLSGERPKVEWKPERDTIEVRELYLQDYPSRLICMGCGQAMNPRAPVYCIGADMFHDCCVKPEDVTSVYTFHLMKRDEVRERYPDALAKWEQWHGRT